MQVQSFTDLFSYLLVWPLKIEQNHSVWFVPAPIVARETPGTKQVLKVKRYHLLHWTLHLLSCITSGIKQAVKPCHVLPVLFSYLFPRKTPNTCKRSYSSFYIYFLVISDPLFTRKTPGTEITFKPNRVLPCSLRVLCLSVEHQSQIRQSKLSPVFYCLDVSSSSSWP